MKKVLFLLPALTFYTNTPLKASFQDVKDEEGSKIQKIIETQTESQEFMPED